MSEKLEVGAIVEGKVTRIKPFGALVAIGDNRQGLVHISQIATNFVQDINDHLAVGDMVKVKILSVDEENKKIALSIKEALPQAPKQNNYKRNENKNNYEPKGNSSNGSGAANSDFEDKMKEWLKQSNERQAGLNKRANRR